MENQPAPPARGRAALTRAILRGVRRPADEPEPAQPRGRGAMVAKMLQTGVADAPRLAPPQQVSKVPPIARVSPIPFGARIEPVASTSTDNAPSPSQHLAGELAKLELPAAPAFEKGPKGTSGAIEQMSCNYIELKRAPNTGFHRYELRFTPICDAQQARRKLIRAIAPEIGDVYIFNGGMDLYLPTRLPNDCMTFEQVHPFDPEVTVTIKVTFKMLEPADSRDSLHFLNVLFKRIMLNLRYKQIQRNYFDLEHKKYVPQHALEIIPGYAVAVAALEGGLMLCVDTCHKMLRKKSVLELLIELKQARGDYQTLAVDEIVGHTVLTYYNNQNYIVDDIAWDRNPTSKFPTSDGGEISYVEYYKKQHGIEIRNMSQPLLVHMRKRKTQVAGETEEIRICLVPELCNLTGISQDMLTHKFRKDIAEHTQLTPSQRIFALERYVSNVHNNPDAAQILAEWGLTIKSAQIDLNARVINDTRITMKNMNWLTTQQSEWGRQCGQDMLIRAIDMQNWVVVVPETVTNLARTFIQRVISFGRGFGCKIAMPRLVVVSASGKLPSDVDYRRALDENVDNSVQIVLAIALMQRDSLYREIKLNTLVRKGVGSQVVLSKTLSNEKISTPATLKIALQMQAKLGGALWGIKFPPVCDDFMFVGIDTYHSKGHQKSVGAIACTISVDHTRYYTGLSFQAHEVTDGLKVQLRLAVEERKKLTGKYPSVVFIMRDGVGDGQLAYCRDYELRQYMEVGKDTGANFKVCFVVIQKRINTRLFTRKRTNPPPGTVLDHTITHNEYEDFYLVPQGTRVGTVAPSHYIVLYNDVQILNLDRIQKLCYKFCHLYYNWPGAVSVPAPCQYAHKAAYLVGQYLERRPDADLNTKLYYL